MKNTLLTLSLLLLAWLGVQAQTTTLAAERVEAHQKRQALHEKSLLKNVAFRNVGPTVMSGRVVDIEANPQNPTEFYVAYASGGLWHTDNNGLSFTPLFDNEAVMTIGDIAVDWAKNTVWVGTGENNSSRSSYAGVGMYRSTDGGKSWQHLGLEETHHIGRIVLHPEDPNTLWVASLGHLYTPNEERGIYKTTDGGKTWKKTLFVSENAGAVDLIAHPENPDVLYAATWERSRAAWNFVESGAGSGIYQSTDGGENWTKLSTEKSGFPTGEGVGRIGLDISRSNPDVLYAVLDNQERQAKDDEDKEKLTLTKDAVLTISKEDFLEVDDEDLTAFLDEFEFPIEHTATSVKEKVRKGEIEPKTLVEYLQDANQLLFDTPVKGLECYKSEDGGKTWAKTHEEPLEDVVYSYGYYFGQVRVNPQNPDEIYTMGVPIIKSEDGGKTWVSINENNVHVDHHALWLNPENAKHIILGNDGGINISYDAGENWFKANSIPVGQFYAVNVDMETPYNVYGGLQDNGVWYGKSTYKPDSEWLQEGQYPYKRIMGGDGMQVEIDTRDNNTVITGYQFGNYFRINKATGATKYITPKHKLGERPLRFNWQAPVHLSRHNQDILYMGSHKFHRSFDQGDNWETLSEDLTQGGKKGDVPYGTLTMIHESPLRFGLIYAGSDDGLVHVSKDGGYSWENISEGLPKNYWVSRVIASAHEEGRVYVTLNGYRFDDFAAMVYVSEDYGKTWKQLGKDLPAEPVNVIREDPTNENLLFVGTDHGVYASLDRGESFMLMNKDLPAVAVHDLVIHPRENDLVVGTHGRSIFIADISAVQKLDKEMQAKKLHLFAVEGARHSPNWGKSWSQWREKYEPETEVAFFAQSDGEAKLEVKTEDGMTLLTMTDKAEKGLNFVTYDFSFDPKMKSKYEKALNEAAKEGKEVELEKADNGKMYLQPGKYTFVLTLNGEEQSQTFEIKPGKEKPQRAVLPKRP